MNRELRTLRYLHPFSVYIAQAPSRPSCSLQSSSPIRSTQHRRPRITSRARTFPYRTSTMYSPVDHTDVTRLNSVERELFRKRTCSLRRQLQTCQDTISSNQKQLLSKKSKLFRGSGGKKGVESNMGHLRPHDVVGMHADNFTARDPYISRFAVSSGDATATSPKDSSSWTNLRPIKDSNPVHSEYTGETERNKDDVGDRDYANYSAQLDKNITCGIISGQQHIKPILNKIARQPVQHGGKLSVRPKSKKFSSATPSISLSPAALMPAKPKSPRPNWKYRRSVRPVPGCQIRIEPGPNLEPAKSIEIKKFKQHRKDSPALEKSCDHDCMDSTQNRIKEFLNKACADAVRSRTKMVPAVSLSDLAAIDDQQMSMPILVKGILGPEERKRQVSKVYPMRTPSPHHSVSSCHLSGSAASHHGSRSSSRVTTKADQVKPGSPLNLPPIILPPIRENKVFQPRRCSWASTTTSEETTSSEHASNEISEKEWKSLRKCRYLRIPDPPDCMKFDLMDNIESVFK